MFGLSALEGKLIGYGLAFLVLAGLLTGVVLHLEHVGAAKANAELATQRAQWQSAQAQAEARAASESARNNDLAAQLADAKQKRKTVYETITRTVEKIVDRPVYRNQCLDPDGLRIANDALAGKAVDPGELAAALPPAQPASGVDGR